MKTSSRHAEMISILILELHLLKNYPNTRSFDLFLPYTTCLQFRARSFFFYHYVSNKLPILLYLLMPLVETKDINKKCSCVIAKDVKFRQYKTFILKLPSFNYKIIILKFPSFNYKIIRLVSQKLCHLFSE